jgi:hypothetical protein
VAAIVQSQSGNPVNIVTGNGSLNGTPNSVGHAKFGPPGNIVGSPTFGKITRTRFPHWRGGLVPSDSAGCESVSLR